MSSSSPPTSGSSSFPVSSTFNPSTSTSSTFSSSSVEPTSSSRGPSNNGNTSATLYLYTFLATLVLLLSVSAAIILRSLILRRRHQRLVAEAMRNGTWVPPSPGATGPFLLGSGGRRVDLTKKPKMWEAFVGSGERQTPRTGKTEAVTEWEWDSIRPFAAAYVTPPGPNDSVPVASSPEPQDRPSLTARLHTLFRNTQQLRVAVLIAMPQPPEAKSRSPTPQLVASTSAAVTPHSNADDETELPHIEFGVAELEVSHTQSNRDKNIRSSVASGSSLI
ncbi:hypothetical protein J132_11202 [Termitomyces sp. J132]|nr:hypothetical protein J132_11202 [Termitomyces sp. J132]